LKPQMVLMLAVVILLSWLSPSGADESFLYYGSTVGGHQFNRPNFAAAPPFAASGVVVAYHRQTFVVNQKTNCVISSVQNGNFDGALHVYEGEFNPIIPLLNVFRSNDNDALGLGTKASRIVPKFEVTAGTRYIVVTSSNLVLEEGDFQNTISCESDNLPNPLVITHGGCTNVQNNTRTCLAEDRFEVRATVTQFNNQTSNAQVVQFGAGDSGLFWFLSPQNWELLIKILNFCSAPSEVGWRVFAAGTTTFGVRVDVVDTRTGQTVVITNPLGSSFQNQIVTIPGSCS
jgi:hypothetical protein